MLERQHTQLVTGLQELYRRTQNVDEWMRTRFRFVNSDQPLTHEILEALGVLHADERSFDGILHGFNGQGQDGQGWISSKTPSPSTQATFSPNPPAPFPQSTIMLKRRLKYHTNAPPVAETPSLMTSVASVKPERYIHSVPSPKSTPSGMFKSNESISMSFDREADSMMDWPIGVDDLVGLVGD